MLNETRLIRFKRIVYLLEKLRKEFVKEIHKELLVRHLGINKTREAVAACYYFPFISRIVKKIVKEYNICNKSKTATRKPYRLLMLLLTLKEL
jgi:Integrase zinc binding domain